MLFLPQASSAQGCGISVSPQTPVVNLPGSSLPTNGALTFYEALSVNYSSAFTNQTITVQYFNGTGWRDLQSFRGNAIGFTEADVGIDSSWARFGQNSVRAVSGTCTSAEVSLVVGSDANAIPEAVAAYGVAGVALGLFYVFGRRLGKMRLVLAAAAVYLAIAPFTGQRYDVYFLLSSGIRILQHVNPFNPGNPALYPGALKWAYPPFYAVYSAFSFAVFQLFTSVVHSIPFLFARILQ